MWRKVSYLGATYRLSDQAPLIYTCCFKVNKSNYACELRHREFITEGALITEANARCELIVTLAAGLSPPARQDVMFAIPKQARAANLKDE